MKFKQLFTVTITFLLLSSFAINNSLGQGGASFRSPDNNKVYTEDNIQQFTIGVMHSTLNQLSRDFQILKETQKLFNYRRAGYSFIPIKSIIGTQNDTISFFTEGFYSVLTLWKSGKSVNGIEQPEEILFYMNNSIHVVEDALMTLDSASKKLIPLPTNVLNLSVGSTDVDANYTHTSQYLASDSIVYKTREFELVFLDIGSFNDLSTNHRFYSQGKRPGDTMGIVIERSFSGLNPFTSDATFDFQSYRSLVFKPLPIPNLRSDYNAESAFAFSHGFGCPPYWRPDGEPSTAPDPVTAFNFSLENDLPPMLRFYQQPPDTINHLNKALVSFAKQVQFSQLELPEKPVKIWDTLWFRILLILLALLGIIFIIQSIRRLNS